MIDASGTDRGAHRLTWLAIIACFTLVIPAMAIGGIPMIIYRIFLGSLVSGHWMPYFEEITTEWFPNILQGGIADFIAINITAKIFKQCNLEIVVYATAAAWIAIALAMAFAVIILKGIDLAFIGLAAQLFGLSLGLSTANFIR